MQKRKIAFFCNLLLEFDVKKNQKITKILNFI